MQIPIYRYHQSPKENVWQKVSAGRKSHESIIVATLPVYIISANGVLEQYRKDLEMFLWKVVKCSSIMGNGWMENVEIIWADDVFPEDIMKILLDQGFDKRSMELKLDLQDDSNDKNMMTYS